MITIPPVPAPPVPVPALLLEVKEPLPPAPYPEPALPATTVVLATVELAGGPPEP